MLDPAANNDPADGNVTAVRSGAAPARPASAPRTPAPATVTSAAAGADGNEDASSHADDPSSHTASVKGDVEAAQTSDASGGAGARRDPFHAVRPAAPSRGVLSGWSPTRRPPRHQPRSIPRRHLLSDHLDGPKDPAAWTLVALEVAEDLGAVRNAMTYDKEYGTSATHYEKPRRTQFMEGPNEPAVGDHMEMSPRFLDFQFQAVALLFRRADGRLVRKYPDVAIEYDDNTVRFGEIKTSQAWFDAPGVKRPLDAVDRALVAHGLPPLLKIKGEAFRSDPTLEAHAMAMDARLTTFDREAEGDLAREAVMLAGGQARYGDVLAALGGARANAADKLHAMLLRRIVSFDLSVPPTADTVVTAPRPARAHALRDLLGRLRREAA